MDNELLETIEEMMENGCGQLEIFEYIQDNTDEDPIKYLLALI